MSASSEQTNPVLKVFMANGSVYWLLGFDDLVQFRQTIYERIMKEPIGEPVFMLFDAVDIDSSITVMLDVTSIQSAYFIQI
jgi:hypothetical protein